MIIFTPHRIIPAEMLEQKGIRQVVVYNLSSYYSDVPTLNMLVPSPGYLPEESLEGDMVYCPSFDISYHGFIMENPDAFCQFMNIIIPAYMSPETMVQILINHSDYRDAILESLVKLIQQRYGYNTYVVNELEDFIYAEESDMSIPGLYAIEQDVMRWHTLVPMDGEVYE